MLFDVTSNFHICAGFCVYLTTCLFATWKFCREVALRVHSGGVQVKFWILYWCYYFSQISRGQIVFNFVCLNRNVSFSPQFQAWHFGFAKKRIIIWSIVTVNKTQPSLLNFFHLFSVPHSTKMPQTATELEIAQYETAKYCHSMVDTDIWWESF